MLQVCVSKPNAHQRKWNKEKALANIFVLFFPLPRFIYLFCCCCFFLLRGVSTHSKDIPVLNVFFFHWIMNNNRLWIAPLWDDSSVSFISIHFLSCILSFHFPNVIAFYISAVQFTLGTLGLFSIKLWQREEGGGLSHWRHHMLTWRLLLVEPIQRNTIVTTDNVHMHSMICWNENESEILCVIPGVW